MESFPPQVLNGLKVAGNMMGAIGLAITGVCIWSNETWVYLLIGFVMSKYLKLTSLQIALVGFAICYLTFFSEMRIKKMEAAPAKAEIKEEEDSDFYG